MKKFAYIILILCLYSCRHETGIVMETINELDATLEMKETYEKAFDSRIKSIREVYRSYIVHMPKVSQIDRFRIVIGEQFLPISETYKDSVQKFIEDHTLS